MFRPAESGTEDGPRIWNEQLLSYAAYGDGGDVTGDPKTVRQYSVSVSISLFAAQFSS